jgi:hypothetical protein
MAEHPKHAAHIEHYNRQHLPHLYAMHEKYAATCNPSAAAPPAASPQSYGGMAAPSGSNTSMPAATPATPPAMEPQHMEAAKRAELYEKQLQQVLTEHGKQQKELETLRQELDAERYARREAEVANKLDVLEMTFVIPNKDKLVKRLAKLADAERDEQLKEVENYERRPTGSHHPIARPDAPVRTRAEAGGITEDQMRQALIYQRQDPKLSWEDAMEKVKPGASANHAGLNGVNR